VIGSSLTVVLRVFIGAPLVGGQVAALGVGLSPLLR
jgi:hypothetical protein